MKTNKTLRRSDKLDKRSEKTLLANQLRSVQDSIIARNTATESNDVSISEQKKQNRKRVLKNKSSDFKENEPVQMEQTVSMSNL